MNIIEGKNIIKTFVNGNVETKVLKGIDIEVKQGEFLAIMGRSGAGKSTLLYQLSLLDTPTSGEITVDEVDIIKLSQRQKTSFRLNRLGYIFQDYALMPDLTAIEQIMIPLLMQGISTSEARETSLLTLKSMDLENRANNLPSQLSGGEQQRVSIARAVAQKPKILFADEPTASLDYTSSMSVIEVLKKLHESGQTIVMITHELEYTTYCDRIINIGDGVIESEETLK